MAGHLETIKRVLDGNYTDASEQEKELAVQQLVRVCSVAAGAVTIQPFPFVDTALITPIQLAMVQGIGKIHGYKLDTKSIVEMLGTFGASIIAQNIVMGAAKFIPFFGWVVSISIGYALTWAIGEVSDHYFKNGRHVDEAELKEMFQRIYTSKKAEKTEQHKADKTLRDKLEQLKRAHKDGLLTDAEFETKKAELLSNF
jgi:uncharacterized protein (DUF697 family)